MAFSTYDDNKTIWRAKPDVVKDSATQVKADFDALLNSNTSDLNSLVGELEDATAAGSIGYDHTASGLSAGTVQGAVDELAAGKVDKATGKGLSTNDYDDTDQANVAANTAARHTHTNKTTLDAITAAYTAEEASKLAGIEAGANYFTLPTASTTVLGGVKVDGASITIQNGVISAPTGGVGDMTAAMYDPNGVLGDAFDAANHAYTNSTSGLTATTTKEAIDELESKKVNKIDGKSLSTNDYTNDEKAKLAGIKADIIGTTSGTSTALTLAQDGFALVDGAVVRIKLHTEIGASPTLNINSTGAIPLVFPGAAVKPIKAGMPAGTWLTFIYSSTSGNFLLQGDGGSAETRFGNEPGQISSFEFFLKGGVASGYGNF